MHVVPIGKYKAKQTIAVLKALLKKAEAGELTGTVICTRSLSGVEDVYLTDIYKRHPQKAAAASTTIHWRVMHLQNDSDSALTGY